MRARGLVLVLALGVGGCASAPREAADDPQSAWQSHQQRVQQLQRWQAKGRLSVSLPGNSGQAHFTWKQIGQRFRLRLAGPWGQGGALVRAGPDGARLDAGEGRRYRGRNARELLAAVYGWDIPVNGLRYWLIGLPRAEASYELDRFGRLATLSWRGWRIEYRRYKKVGDVELPALLHAQRGEDTEIRLAIHEWRLDGETHRTREPAGPDDGVPLIGG